MSLDFFQSGLNDKLKNICKNIKNNSELEISFSSFKKPISLKKFYDLLKYASIRSNKNLKLENITTLDIIYTYDHKTTSSYRISILDIDEINKFILNNNLLKNYTIFSRLIKMILNKDKNIILIDKKKDPNNYIALTEYDIRFRLSDEDDNIEQSVLNDLLRLDENENNFIIFRYKQRKSLIIFDDNNYTLRLDITNVKTSNNLKNLNNSLSNYELELDFTFKKKISEKTLSEVFNKMYEETFNIEKFIQQSSILITKTEISNVIKSLNKLAYDNNENVTYKDLPAMSSASVEVHNVLDDIPGNYTASDKADGERYFLMIYESNIYLISNNLEVKKIKELKNDNYNLTVLDGEYLYIHQYKKNIYLAFDILFYKGGDIRNTEKLLDRFEKLSKVLDNLFNIKMIIGDITNTTLNVSKLDEIENFHKTNMIDHLKQLNKLLKEEKDNQIINYKYFIFPIIGNQYNIYKLSELLYDIYTSTDNRCPYILDGIIYTPINQKYTRSLKDIKFKILKWKPEKQNSIDFYVQFERNKETNKIVTVYDRTNEKSIEKYTDNNTKNIEFNDITDYKVNSNLYQILNLYVGKFKNNREDPILFQNENNLHQSYVYIQDGYPKDLEGNIIEDNTVVEFIYENDINIPDKFRWKPMRTRYDKTESVMRFKRKYGNNYEIANRIWNSIQNPITFNDIKLLGNPKTANEHIKILKSKITSVSISLARRDDKYYQLITNLGKVMRNFHNWIKSNIIYTYCGNKTLLDNTNVLMDVLDIGAGRGGDLMKFYHAKIKSAVCCDPNYASLFSGADGAISRYNIFKKKMPNFPKINFIVADAGKKLDYLNQSLNSQMNDQNIKLLKQTFGDDDNTTKYNTFDIINAQFMIHYLLKDIYTWNNFCYNVNKYLRKDGYLLITTFDGNIVHNKLDNGNFSKDYINDDGQKKVLFNITKKYSTDIKLENLNTVESNLGLQIDIHAAWMFEEGGSYIEYLVNPKFLINQLRRQCNMRLVETETFQNLYYVYEDFFVRTANYESKEQTKKFFNDVKEFYNLDNELTKNLFEFSRLHRYYIFQKL